MTVIEAVRGGAVALGRRERNKRDKAERIKQAARKLFAQYGVEATTIRQIAEAADIGLGTVFSYAANKEDLLVQIFREEVGAAVERAFATVPKKPVLEQVLHIFNAIVTHHRENPHLARVFVKETPFIDDKLHGIAEFVAGLLGGLAVLIEDAKARHELKEDVPAALLARNLFAIYFQHVQFWLRGRAPAADLNHRQLRMSLELHLAGLRCPARRQRR